MSGISIKRCGCESRYQDAKYGNGQRVHTIGAKSATCTVCATPKALEASEVKKVGKEAKKK